MFMHLPDARGDWVGHYGGVEGFMASMWLIPGADLRYVVLVNQSDGVLYALEATLLDHLDALAP
jgi:hypothetical protein